MRICLVSLDYKPYRSSGLAIYAEDLARGLTELGHSVTVMAAHRPGLPYSQTIGNLELRRIPLGHLDWISYSRQTPLVLNSIARVKPFDVVHFLDVHFAYAFPGPFVGSVWQSFRQRLIANRGWPYHTGCVDMLRRQFYYRIARKWMEATSLSRASKLIASCNSTRNEFVLNYGIAPERIDIAIQGINTTLFRPLDARAIRQRLGLDDCHVLLFAGFITPRKGLNYLAQALRYLPKDTHLLIMGAWDKYSRKIFYSFLGSHVANVHELGYVADEARPYYYSLADVYVSPSFLEGLGITPIEALACGTPAVVTSASSGPEEVGEAGIVVPPHDPLALAQGIQCLFNDYELRLELGQRGRERILELFTYQRMAKLTLQTYRNFLENSSGAENARGIN